MQAWRERQRGADWRQSRQRRKEPSPERKKREKQDKTEGGSEKGRKPS